MLYNCFKLLDEKLQVLGFEKEVKDFNPHITLARIKHIRPDTEQITKMVTYNFPEIKIETNEIVLMQSTLTPKGARYTIVQRFSLHS